MNVSAVSASPTAMQASGPPATSAQDSAKALAQLIKDVQSGDVTDAQSDLATLSQQIGASRPYGMTDKRAKILVRGGLHA